jgi:hypothetical protein
LGSVSLQENKRNIEITAAKLTIVLNDFIWLLFQRTKSEYSERKNIQKGSKMKSFYDDK